MTSNITINAIPSSYVNTGSWTVFNSGTFSSGFGLVPNTVTYNERRQPNTAGTGGSIRYSEETVTVPAQSMSKTSASSSDVLEDGKLVINRSNSIGTGRFEEGQTSYQTIYDYPGEMYLFSRAIDLSKFSSIKVTREIAQGNTEVQAWLHLCPSNKKAWGVSKSISVANSKTGTFTTTYDISDMSGQYFFGISGYTSYSNYSLRITKIELVA